MTTTEIPAVDAALPNGFAEELTRALSGEVAFDDYSRHMFSRDASMYTMRPLAVVYPMDAGDVAATVRIAAAYGIAVTARGAGTSLAGQTVGAGIILDHSHSKEPQHY